ncbi:MAG: EAL domain-containing protein [Thermoleophilia bacterium]|nr:EAL domain-containing protein [Thermoleophilia bacterium]
MSEVAAVSFGGGWLAWRAASGAPPAPEELAALAPDGCAGFAPVEVPVDAAALRRSAARAVRAWRRWTDPARDRRQMAALLAPGGLDVAFQPLVDLAGGGVMGHEALARPRVPGLASPLAAFGLARRLGREAELDAACLVLAVVRGEVRPAGSPLWVNLTPSSLGQEGIGAEGVIAVVGDAGRVVVEVTEQAAPRALAGPAATLRAGGLGVAVDDAGAGSAGLDGLRDLKADYIKIDGGLLRDAAEGRAPGGLVQAMVGVAHRLGAIVVAEGIETEEHLAFARDVGAELGQGWLLGRPGPLSPAGPGGSPGGTRSP